MLFRSQIGCARVRVPHHDQIAPKRTQGAHGVEQRLPLLDAAARGGDVHHVSPKAARGENGFAPVVDALTYYVDLMNWLFEGRKLVEIYARGQMGVLKEAGHEVQDICYAVLTYDDGAVVNLGVSYALPEKYPALGHAARVEVVGTEGVLIMDDDHTDQLMYSEKGVPHVYLPGHSVNMVFLQSGTPGDWALGDFWGPIANETRAWLDHLATGKPCVLVTVDFTYTPIF